MAGWIVIGVASSWVLLEFFHLRSPLLRYPITALVMYALSIVAGTRLWLAAFSRTVRMQPGRFGAEPAVAAGNAKFRLRGTSGGSTPFCLGAIFPRRDVRYWFDAGATLFCDLLTLTAPSASSALIGMDRFSATTAPGLLRRLSNRSSFGRAPSRHLPRRRRRGVRDRS